MNKNICTSMLVYRVDVALDAVVRRQNIRSNSVTYPRNNPKRLARLWVISYSTSCRASAEKKPYWCCCHPKTIDGKHMVVQKIANERSPCTFPRQDMLMEIMDKYVQTGEALAEKENEVVQLTKQVCSVFLPRLRTIASSALLVDKRLAAGSLCPIFRQRVSFSGV